MSFANNVGGQATRPVAVSSPTTGATLTVAQVLRGILDIGTAGGAVAITTAAAADLIAEVPGLPDGYEFGSFVIIANGANAVTLSAGGSVTLAASSTTVSANTSARYRVVKTSSTAVTIYRS